MEEKIKILSKTNMFCSICEEEHEVELIEKEKEVTIKGEKIKYKEKFYRCNKYKNENTFQTGELWNEGLINSIDKYIEKRGLLTSYETKQMQDEARDKIMKL